MGVDTNICLWVQNVPRHEHETRAIGEAWGTHYLRTVLWELRTSHRCENLVVATEPGPLDSPPATPVVVHSVLLIKWSFNLLRCNTVIDLC